MTYEKLEHRFKELALLEQVSSTLSWDSATQLPAASADARGEQMATLAALKHQKLTAPEVAGWLADAEAKQATLGEWQQANLREMKRRHAHAVAVDEKLVSSFSKACVTSEHAWREARKQNDFASFEPHQQNIFDLTREIAQAKSAALKLEPYDALLDQYDPGLTQADIDPVFTQLESFLPDMVNRVIEKQAQHKRIPITDKITAETQLALCKRFMDAVGFDFAHGRIDTSTHPFCCGGMEDVRITTRFREERIWDGLFGTLHETGHAMYEFGLPYDWRHQPVGEARGMSMHESQSLFVEMQLAQSREFLAFALPIIRQQAGVGGPEWSDENVYHTITQVERSLIRVDADEVTYPLHVMLRYGLEKQLLAGKLRAKDLPEIWDAEMQRLIGVRPDNVANGCLQDIHWPEGMIGYFPTYTLGAMIAAQLMASVKSALPNVAQLIAQGEFAPIFNWLQKNVHTHGSRVGTVELLTLATGKGLDVAIYKAHLEQRYLG